MGLVTSSTERPTVPSMVTLAWGPIASPAAAAAEPRTSASLRSFRRLACTKSLKKTKSKIAQEGKTKKNPSKEKLTMDKATLTQT